MTSEFCTSAKRKHTEHQSTPNAPQRSQNFHPHVETRHRAEPVRDAHDGHAAKPGAPGSGCEVFGLVGVWGLPGLGRGWCLGSEASHLKSYTARARKNSEAKGHYTQ